MSLLHLEGAYENELATTGEFNRAAPKTALMLPSGERIVLPTELLLEALRGGTLAAGGRPAELAPATTDVRGAAVGGTTTAAQQPAGPVATAVPGIVDAGSAAEETVIPLVEEQLQVGKRAVETGRVRVRRETEEHVQRVSIPLTEVHWEVEHVPVERLVEAQPEVRQVGETLIFPLVEERMVVRRELWLREEVHMRKVSTTVEKSAEFPVKRDVLIEERTEV